MALKLASISDPFELQPALITLFNQTGFNDNASSAAATASTSKHQPSSENDSDTLLGAEGEHQKSPHQRKEEVKQGQWKDHFDKYGRGASMYRTQGRERSNLIEFAASDWLLVIV